VLTTNQKGAVAEAAIAYEAIKLGVGVYKPIADERCDFIFDLHPRLVRVQCKWASRYDDVIILRLYSARRTATGLRRTVYSPHEIDAFAIYCDGNCYFLEMDEVAGRSQVMLRTGEPRNNQRAKINWAKDYEFAAKLGSLPGP
jgi:PD-(D/E)XK endonuclease